jgi:hypothetical protein
MLRFLAALILVVVGAADRAAAQNISGDWEYSLAFDRVSGSSVAVINKYLGSSGPAVIPAIVDGYPVRAIGSGTASIDSSSKLTGLVIPDSATSISKYAFWQATNLGHVTIGAGVRSIGYAAFAYAINLAEVTLPDSVTTFGGYAFYGATNLSRLTLGSGLTNIGVAEFSNCPQLTEVVIPEGVTTIGDFAFNYGGGLTNVIFPSTLTNIGAVAFQQCSQLRSVVIPDAVQTIGREAFAYGTSLTNVVLGQGVTNIGRAAFAFCDSLPTVTVGGGVTNIADSILDGCAQLSSVIFGSAVSSVGDFALADCPRLTSVLFLGAPPDLAGTASNIFGTNEFATVYFLPASQGWQDSWAGRPTRPFRPTARQPAMVDRTLVFSWDGTGEVPVSVERSSTLEPGSWETLARGVINGTYNDENRPPRHAFYRMVYP